MYRRRLPRTRTYSNQRKVRIMKFIVFDIETAGIRDKALELAEPFRNFEPLPPFDPKAVKVGNLKNPDKIAEKIREAEEEYPQRVKEHEEAYEKAKLEYQAKVVSKAALNALCGRVVAIGIKTESEETILSGEEADILKKFWEFYGTHGDNFVGWNIAGFDVPFLVRRSWMRGVQFPTSIYNGRFLSVDFIDLMEKFACGEYGYKLSLDNAAKFFGVPGKYEGEVTGENFAQHFEGGDPVMRKCAEEYLLCDLRATWAVAEKMLNVPATVEITDFC